MVLVGIPTHDVSEGGYLSPFADVLGNGQTL